MATSSDPKRRIVDHLKRTDHASASELAAAFGVTATSVRQQLELLESAGLVEREQAVPGGGRGRPAMSWRLTSLAAELFPDRHADLTVDLIDSIREALGDDGLDAVIASRSKRQRAAYRHAVGESPVSLRASKLAEIRSAEGYLAEVAPNDDGSLTLVEHHCPICDAAATCQGLCRDELETFQELFSDVATVERTSHLLSGDQRCAYRIEPLSSRTGSA